MNKKLTFIVPESFERKFKRIVEENEMDHVTIKISGDEQLIDIAKIVTLEVVRTQAERAKNILKRDYYLANKETIVMKDNLSHMLASPINRFFNSKEYRVWKNGFGDDLLMKKTDLDAVEASRIVNEYGPKLVESVVILENHWLFMTSFSCFIHNNNQIDDCADLSKVRHQEKAVAFIRRKTQFRKDYFELLTGLVMLNYSQQVDSLAQWMVCLFPLSLGHQFKSFQPLLQQAFKPLQPM